MSFCQGLSVFKSCGSQEIVLHCSVIVHVSCALQLCCHEGPASAPLLSRLCMFISDLSVCWCR